MFANELAFLTLALIAGAYVSLMSIFSWSSRNRVPMLGHDKHCEIDSYLAFSLIDVRLTNHPGNSTLRINAAFEM